MAKVITYSTVFPRHHFRAGQPTYFVPMFWQSIYGEFLPHDIELDNLIEFVTTSLEYEFDPKNHTIRKGHRWKKGDLFSPRIWGTDVNPKTGRSGPYHSKQIILAPDQLLTDVWDIEIFNNDGVIEIGIRTAFNNSVRLLPIDEVAKNDGLTVDELISWFNVKPGNRFIGQILCWHSSVNY